MASQQKKRLWVHITPSNEEKANVTISATRKPQLCRGSEEKIGSAAGHSPLEDNTVLSTWMETGYVLGPSAEHEHVTFEVGEDQVLISLVVKTPVCSPAVEYDGFQFVDSPLSPVEVEYGGISMTASIDLVGLGGDSDCLAPTGAATDCSQLQYILNRVCRSFPFLADCHSARKINRMAQSCPALLPAKA